MKQRADVSIVRIHDVPDAIVELFRNTFSRHPVSRFDSSLARAFLGTFARHATFLVARDASLNEVGFLIGGLASVLDSSRAQFIRKRFLWMAAASLHDARLMRSLFARVPPKHPPDTKHSCYQVRFIAVAPNVSGRGVGTRLLQAFEQTLPPGSSYHAWTLAGEHGAQDFYRANGFERDLAIGDHIRFCKQIS